MSDTPDVDQQERTMKEFHIGDILSVTHDRLVSPRHVEGVYDILGHMTGESLMTHQLPRVAEEARPVLLKALPFLNEISAFGVTANNWRNWLDSLVLEYGEMHPVPTLTEDQHERIDPLSEAAEYFNPKNIIVVKP
jgi:hypothetical protein